MFRSILVVNLFIQLACMHPLNYGAHTSEYYNSFNPQQRYQRSFPGYYNNGMFHQHQLNPVYGHPMEVNNRPMYRRNIYENSGFRHQFEQQSPVGLFGPAPAMHQSKPIGGHDESRLIVLPRGVDEEDFATNPLKTKMIEGFDEEDRDMMNEEEMGDALSFIDSKTPTRYASERISKPPKHTAPSLHMEMAPPTTRMPTPPSPMAYGLPQPYGGDQGMPQHHNMMMSHPENYQHQMANYQMAQYESDSMYPPQSYQHQHQKRYQPQHQYYQSPRYNSHQYESHHHYDEPMYLKKNMYPRTKIPTVTPPRILPEDNVEDDFYDDDTMAIEDETVTLLEDTDLIVEDNSIDDVSSDILERDSEEEMSSRNAEFDDMENNDSNTTDQPEYDDHVEVEEIDFDVDEEEKDESSSEN